MATNIKYPGPYVALKVAVASGITSGDPVEISDMHGVALEDRDSDGNAVVRFPGTFVADVAAEAVNGSGNSAVALGNALYYDSAETIKINKDSSNGKFIGYALEAISAGSNDTIKVLFSGGSGRGATTQIAKAFAKLDLSGSAQADVVIEHFTASAVLLKVILLYTEASSADAGVTVTVGKESDADYYYTGTSEVSQSQWDETEVTLLQNDIAAGDTVICGNAGGKTGTGEILVIIEYALA